MMDLIQDQAGNEWIKELIGNHSIGARGGQTSTIILELCMSCNDPAFMQQIDVLLEDIRSTFHRYRPGDKKYTKDVTFMDTPKGFQEKIADAPKDLKAELVESYDLVWLHEEAKVGFSVDDDRSLIAKNYLLCEPDEIEFVAIDYLAVPQWRSKTLEWVLVNSLLYAATQSFFEMLPVPEPMTRWRLFGKKHKHQSSLDKQAELMANVHKLAQYRNFNAGVVRQAAYHAANHGVVFSNYVYDLLDRRISASNCP